MNIDYEKYFFKNSPTIDWVRVETSISHLAPILRDRNAKARTVDTNDSYKIILIQKIEYYFI